MTFIESLLNGEAVEIHGDGLQTRSFTYVEDTVDGLHARSGDAGVARRGRQRRLDGALSIRCLAEKIQDKLEIPQPLRATFIGYDEMPGNYQDVRHRIPDTTKAQALLGFEAKVSLDEGLERTIDWHREQRLLDARAAGA